MIQYDYLIVGAGLFGSVFAHEAKKRNKRCLIIDKRNHAGGNIYSEKIENINVHKYGAHIFHTSDKEIWNYVNQFVEFNNFINQPIAIYKNQLYNLPFNMNTFSKIWGIKTPLEAEEIILKQIKEANISSPSNLEEQAIFLVGKDIYEKLIKGYTEKQWGRKCADLPVSIIKRLPVRFNFDNNYFNDTYQGIPKGGYNKLIEKLTEGIEIKLNTDFFENKNYFLDIAEKIVYTGMIDEFYGYSLGFLDYRGLKFETEILDIKNFQGNAVVNYTEKEISFTRIIEHKHFEFGDQEKTVITKEYPENFLVGKDAYYPINDRRNNDLFRKYKELSSNQNKVIFGGRLANYQYYDMDQVIASALIAVKKEFS
jgi:UDP-galactopyranose mutase